MTPLYIVTAVLIAVVVWLCIQRDELKDAIAYMNFTAEHLDRRINHQRNKIYELERAIATLMITPVDDDDDQPGMY